MRFQTTYAQLAEKFSVSEGTVAGALKWGEENGVFRIDAQISVEQHILDVRDSIQKLEKRLDRALDLAEKFDQIEQTKTGPRLKVMPSRHYILIFTELREQRMLLMELEGVYKKQLNISDMNVQNNNFFVLPRKMDASEWEDMAQKTPSQIRAIVEHMRG